MADCELTLEDRKDLIDRLLVAATELQTLAHDHSFRFNRLTGSVARLVHDWCVLVRQDDEDSLMKVANDLSS